MDRGPLRTPEPGVLQTHNTRGGAQEEPLTLENPPQPRMSRLCLGVLRQGPLPWPERLGRTAAGGRGGAAVTRRRWATWIDWADVLTSAQRTTEFSKKHGTQKKCCLLKSLVGAKRRECHDSGSFSNLSTLVEWPGPGRTPSTQAYVFLCVFTVHRSKEKTEPAPLAYTPDTHPPAAHCVLTSAAGSTEGMLAL